MADVPARRPLPHAERRFALYVGIALVLLTSIPAAFAWLYTPPDAAYTGALLMNAADLSVYSSFIEQIREGHWMVRNLYTSDLTPTARLDIFWLAVGLFARVTRLAAPLAIHLVRLALIVPFILFLHALLAELIVRPVAGWSVRAVRRGALLLIAFASGASVLAERLLPAAPAGALRTYPLDLSTAEAITTLTVLASPHFIASLLLLLATFRFALRAVREERRRPLVAASACAFLLLAFHPYYVPTVLGVLAAWAILDGVVERRIPWRILRTSAWIAAACVPPAAYYAWLLATDPATAGHASQNVLHGPTLRVALVSYGALVPLALVGIAAWFRTFGTAERFQAAWLATTIALVASAIPWARKLTMGLHVVLALAAAQGLPVVLTWLRTHLPTPIARYGMTRTTAALIAIPIFGLSTLAVFAQNVAYAALPRDAGAASLFYLPRATIAAMSWIRAHAHSDEATLAFGMDGNAIPHYAVRVTAYGHDHMTTDAPRKRAQLRALAEGTLAVEDSTHLLRELRVRYILVTDATRARWTRSPATLPGVRLAFATTTAEVYEVLPPT